MVTKEQVVITCLVIALTLLHSSAEGRMCKRPRPLKQGRYEYERSSDHGNSHLPPGYVVRVVCTSPARLVGDEYMVCRSDGRWNVRSYCNGTTFCIQPPTAPLNGFVRVRKQSAGSVARYGCDPGFRLVGQKTTVCDGNTQRWRWRGQTPQCRLVLACPVHVDLPSNGAVELRRYTGFLHEGFRRYTEGTVLRYTCAPGYYPSRDVSTTCRRGTWILNGAIPQCNKIVCYPPTLEQIDHGQSFVENRTYDINEIVRYTCDIGYRLDGRSWQVCRVSTGPIGVWSDQVPQCQVVQCPDPGPNHLDGDGRVSFSSPERGLGSVMTLRCSSHLTLLGSSERVCQTNGLWNGTLTSCNSAENYCPALGNPIHGSKVQPVRYGLNSVVRFRCDEETEMVGSSERTCTLTGEWTGEMPRCLARDEFDDMERVTTIMGETVDDLAIDGNRLSNRDPNGATSRRKRAINLQSDKGLDIFFAFDGSGSIGEENFKRGKKFATMLVEKVFVSQATGGARVGALVYSTYPTIIFNVNEYDNSSSVIEAIGSLVKLKGDGTNLPRALEEIKVQMIGAAMASAPQNRKVLFIITDGLNNMGGSSVQLAEGLQQDFGVAIHCIGISRSVNKAALSEIASRPHAEHIFFLPDYVELEDAVSEVTQTNRSYDECGKAGSVTSQRRGRILGGNTVQPGRWPWQAAIYKQEGLNEHFECGGTLIRKRWVLTAAHCFHTITQEQTIVYLGLTNRLDDLESERFQRFRVTKLVSHPDYDRETETYFHDIALLQLENDAHLNRYVRTICLPPSVSQHNIVERFLRTGLQGHVIGWGHATQLPVGSSATVVPVTDLKEIILSVASNFECKKKMTKLLPNFADSQFCGGDGTGQPDACKGDSGGPFMVRDVKRERFVEVGIVSYGQGCGQNQTYGIYTRLPAYVDWIMNEIQPST